MTNSDNIVLDTGQTSVCRMVQESECHMHTCQTKDQFASSIGYNQY